MSNILNKYLKEKNVMKRFTCVALALLFIFTLSLTAMASDWEEGSLVGTKSVTFEAKKASVAQAFDGKITEGEYYKIELTEDMMSYTSEGADNSIAKGLKYDVYLSWDDNNVRTAIVYKKGNPYFNAYEMDGGEGNIYNRTAIQVCCGIIGNEITDFVELGFGRNSDNGNQLNVSWRQSISGTDFTSTAVKDYTVALDANGDLIYEVAVPWVSFAPAAMKLGESFGWLGLVAGGTEEAGYVHSQIAAGCSGTPGKDSSYFAQVKLVDAPPAPVAEAPLVVEVTDDNPPTSDISVIMYVLAALSSLGGAVVINKRK